LCRLSTGGASRRRQLYTDNSESLINACRPTIITSVAPVAKAGDLLDRVIRITATHVPDDERRTEKEVWDSFYEARPRIFGAILNTLSAVLATLPDVKLKNHARMADFCRIGVATEKVLGWPEGSFMKSYLDNRRDAAAGALEGEIVAEALYRLVERSGGTWAGTAKKLLAELQNVAGAKARKSPEWPTNARVLSSYLRSETRGLSALGVELQFDLSVGGEKRVIRAIMANLNDPESSNPCKVGENENSGVNDFSLSELELGD
jgi:hypothetical protein